MAIQSTLKVLVVGSLVAVGCGANGSSGSDLFGPGGSSGGAGTAGSGGDTAGNGGGSLAGSGGAVAGSGGTAVGGSGGTGGSTAAAGGAGGAGGSGGAGGASCAPESDAAFCTRLGKACGSVTANDNCGASRTVAYCGTCTPPATCSATNACGCAAETNTEFCTRLGRNCAAVTAADNCGTSRTVAACGSCTLPDVCSAGNVCGPSNCTPETDTAFCTRLGKNCGAVTSTDNCGAPRAVASCGACTAPATCGATNVCSCTPEDSTAFCLRLSKVCGSVTASDNCGASRTVTSCGTCTPPQTCTAGNVCACVAETDAAFCARLGKNCGSWTGADNCGTARTAASCGLCSAPQSCGGGGTVNVCGTPGGGAASAFETKAPAAGGTTVGLAPKAVAIVGSSTRPNKITLGAAKQKVIGFGVSLTESSAKMLDSIAAADRTMIIDEYFNPAKGGMNLVRLPIATCDFALVDYSYQDSANAAFSIAHDDTSGLIKLILDAQTAAGGAGKIKFLANTWTAPPWMKSNNSYVGGTLNASSNQAFADYLKNYVAAYAAKGIPIWGITPQNEPEHMGQFPTMGFPGGAGGETTLIANALGPTLKTAYPNIKILGFDHNKGSSLVNWANSINGNATARGYTDGMANHWYGSTWDPGDASLESVHSMNPNWIQIGAEQGLSAINAAAVVNAAWMNDTWFWNRNSPDWGGGSMPDHPIVNGMFRYVEDIIVTFNHWQQGWIQWNAVTDKWGGPSHGDDPTNAVHAQSPFMVDVCGQQACAGAAFAVRGTKAVFKVPTLYALEHFAKYFKPDGTILATTVSPAPPAYIVPPAPATTPTRPSVAAVGTKNPDNSIAINILNMNDAPVDYQIVLPDNRIVETTISAKALQTVLLTP